MTPYQFPSEETSINLTNISEQVYCESMLSDATLSIDMLSLNPLAVMHFCPLAAGPV